MFANPFSCDIEQVPSKMQMNVIGLICNDILDITFCEIKCLVKFFRYLPFDFETCKDMLSILLQV